MPPRLALSAHGCDQPNSPTGPSTTAVTFTGRIVEYVSQTPAAAAVVRFTLEPPDAQFGALEATTNADGQYVLTVPRTDVFAITVDNAIAGVARVNGRAYRGDLFVRGGTCISRYGLVIDDRTLRPVRGATVTLGQTAITGADGWYRIDLGCPEVVLPGGTTFIYVTHPDYQMRQLPVGRGVADVRRLDIGLQHR